MTCYIFITNVIKLTKGDFMSAWLYETVHYHNGDIGLKRLDENEEPLFVVRTAQFAKDKLSGDLEEVVMQMFEAAMLALGGQDEHLFDDVLLSDEILADMPDNIDSACNDIPFDKLLPSIH